MMAKTQPVDRSRQLPDFVQINGSKTMPDGMTNFIRSTICPMYRTMLRSARVEPHRRSTSANGSLSFKIESFKPRQATIVLDMSCGGFARRVHLTTHRAELSWYVLDELRAHAALAEDCTRNVTRCQNCRQQLRFPLEHEKYHNGTLIFARDTPICDSCVQDELGRLSALQKEAADVLFGDELFASEPPPDESQDFLEQLRPEVVATATHEDTRRKPWWRRRRK